jgi:trigger factor
MNIRKEWKELENSQVKLKITVPQKEVKKEYDDLLSEYSKNASIKGFRRGKVPVTILERKFGEGVKAETVKKILEKSIELALEKTDYRPLSYSIPKLTEDSEKDLKAFEIDKPLVFELTYDVYPKITVGEYKSLIVEEPVVSVKEEDIKRELEIIQEQNAIIVEKKESKVEKDNTVTIDYVELDDKGNEKQNTKREDFTFAVGSGYNIYKIDEDILGMKKGEEKTLEKEYSQDFTDKNLAGKKISLKVKVSNIKEKKLPEIDDELAQDVSEKYSSLEDLKKDIKKRLKETSDMRLKEYKINQILDKIEEKSTIPVPEAMIQYNLSLRLKDFINRFGGNEKLILEMLKKQGKELKDLLEEWRPDVIKNIKTALIINEIGKIEKIEIPDKELDEKMKKDADILKRDYKEYRKELEKRNVIEAIRENLKNDKIYNMLLDNAEVKKGKKIDYLDFIQGKY